MLLKFFVSCIYMQIWSRCWVRMSGAGGANGVGLVVSWFVWQQFFQQHHNEQEDQGVCDHDLWWGEGQRSGLTSLAVELSLRSRMSASILAEIWVHSFKMAMLTTFFSGSCKITSITRSSQEIWNGLPCRQCHYPWWYGPCVSQASCNFGLVIWG